MINFDVYRNTPAAAAALIAREGDCSSCPMYEKCNSAPNHDYDKCFEMWMIFFKFNTIGSVEDFSELLSIMIDCDKCTVKKVNECDFHETRDCGLTLCKWLCKKIPTCQESRQVGLESLHPDDAKAVKEILKKADEKPSDEIKPSHYRITPDITVWDVIDPILSRTDYTSVENFMLGNVIKYVLRADLKGGVEDYRKAMTYLKKLIESRKGRD